MTHFYLDRVEDESGISGTGRVAEGVVFSNGWCAMHWLTRHTSVAFYESLAEVEAIHGHNGKTRVTQAEPLPEAFAYLDAAIEIAKNKISDDYAYAVLDDAHRKVQGVMLSRAPSPERSGTP